MDGREGMSLAGSSPYFMQQRGLGGSGAGMPANMHGSSTVRPLSGPNFTVQSTMSGGSVSTYPVESPASVSPHGAGGSMLGGGTSSEPVKRKRGRPRKYGPDGTMALALSPLSSASPSSLGPSEKRGRGRPPGSGKKQQLAALGVLKKAVTVKSKESNWLAGSAGMGFTPHIIPISMGEDIASKIMSFSQQGPRAICILSASGAVSTVTLRQPSTSGGTVTYEGRFEILCLSGSYLVSESGGTRSRTGGLSVSLASPDGRVIGGGVAGLLIAASAVQVIVGSFTYGGVKKPNPKPGIPYHGELESGVDSPVALSDKSNLPLNISPSRTVSSGGWPISRSMDIRNTHIDLDLTRG